MECNVTPCPADLGPGGGIELLIVDPGVAGAAILLDGRRADVEVVHLTPDGRPLEQIADHLAGRRGVAAVHILSHGEPGALLLAGERVDAAALAAGDGALARIAGALGAGAQVALYGCSVAAGAAGIGFLASLEAELGVEVAASAGPVGALALGGRWTLRGRDGTTVDPVFAPSARAAYPGLLTILGGGADVHVGGAGNDEFTVTGLNHLSPLDFLNGGDGFDTIVISASVTVTLGPNTLLNFEFISITAGVQVIISDDATIATNQTLTIDASNCPDTVSLNFAAETDGTLSFTGGHGSDTVTSGASNDTLSGAGGNDLLLGGSGNDALYGGDGTDTLSGGAGADMLLGGAGGDLLRGGSGGDVLRGSDGGDTLSGGSGGDTLSGGAGDDLLHGGGDSDADVLVGGAGNDTFTGSAQNLDGDAISDFSVGDSIVVTGVDLSSLDGLTASGTLDLVPGGDSLTLTGITSGSGTFRAVYDGTNTTITLAAPSDGGDPLVVVVNSTSSDGHGEQTITNTGGSSASAPVVQNTGNNGNVVTATLPPSVSVTSEGPTTAQSGTTASDTLINAIDARDAPGESGSINGAQGFLDTLAPTTPLDVRTIVPSTVPGVSTDDPIVITGSAGDQVEGFVIDMRSISGKTLQVDNIEFVSVMGNATVTGGAGSNYAVGDDNVQFISLGAGDDTLYGGGGNDTIGSADGDDALHGDAGADQVFGGAGNDTLWGGTETDVVYGNQDADVLYGNQSSDTLFGGQGNDVLYGGQDADVLCGNLGDDTMVGGAGADLFMVAGGGGADVIADFDGAGGDRLQLEANANGGTIDTFDELRAAAADTGDGVLLDLGAGNTVNLMGLSAGQLQSEWFVFS